jgi:tetratricopeptide (TPR) repeat protein
MSTTQSFQSSSIQPLYPSCRATPRRSHYQAAPKVNLDALRQHECEAAIAHSDKSITRQPDDVNAWYERGQAQANLGSYPEAIASFNQALFLKPQHAAALVFRAVAFIHLSCYEEALLSCNAALALEPHNSEAWLFRGVALRSLSRYQEAYISYDSALGIRRPAKKNIISKLLGCFARPNRKP